ncbi:TolC family protein [Parafilimonas sp.]|uniref:TolC family protein n=1 Tax=Parafilimonas sp. TaxID=1969739 RepID=UPI0039E660DF
MHLLPNIKSTVQRNDSRKNRDRPTVLHGITVAGFIKKIAAKRSLLCVLLLTGIACFGQQPLTLDSAIAIALRNSYDIEVARNNAEAADINNSYGMAGGLPVVTGTATDREQVNAVNQKISTGETINRKSAAGNTAAAGLQGSLLLYNGLLVVATKHRLEELEKQSEEYLNASIINTIATVMTQYYDVVRQQSYLTTLDTSIAVGEQRLNIVKTQLGVGLANNADVFQSQLDLNALVQSRKIQELAIEQAKTSLLTTLTLKPDSNIVIADTIIVDAGLRLEDVMDNIYRSPDVAAANMQVTINQLIEKETAAQRYPSLYANTGYSYSRSQTAAGNVLLNQTYGPYVGLSLTVPIYNGSVYKRQQKIAAINTANARLQQNILVRDNTSTAVKNYEAYQKSLQQLQNQRESYALAKQLLDLVLMKFQARVATIVDVKNAQESFANAGYLLVNLSYAAKAAEIEMKRLTYQLK